MHDSRPRADEQEPPINEAGIRPRNKHLDDLSPQQQAKGSVYNYMFQVLRHGRRYLSERIWVF